MGGKEKITLCFQKLKEHKEIALGCILYTLLVGKIQHLKNKHKYKLFFMEEMCPLKQK